MEEGLEFLEGDAMPEMLGGRASALPNSVNKSHGSSLRMHFPGEGALKPDCRRVVARDVRDKESRFKT